MIYFAVSLFMGSFTSMLLAYNIILGAAVAASFLALIFFTIVRSYWIQVTVFFFIGVFSWILYFNFQINENSIKARIVEKTPYYTVVSYDSRKIAVIGDLGKSEVGENIIIEGKFSSFKYPSRGIVGCFYVDNFKAGSKDLLWKMYSFRKSLFNSFSSELGEEKAAFVMAICFGDSSHLEAEQKNDFQTLGVVHAVSVSGFHMAAIYTLLEKLIGLYPSLIASFVYLIFTGSQPSTARAFFMIFILKLSKKFKMNYDGLSSISLSAMLLLLFRPYYILDIGFMLSYLATIGIILFYKKTLLWFTVLPRKLNESLSLSLSAQVFSLPYASFYIKNVSTGFLLGNVILLPLYTGIVLLGNIAMICFKAKVIFKFINKIIYILLIDIDGASSILLDICPPVKYFTATESWVVVFFIISVILVKYKFNNAKYMPLVLSLVLIFQTYCFFPEIVYVNFGKSDSIILRYRASSILITDQTIGSKLTQIKKEFGTISQISAKDGENSFVLRGIGTLQISRPEVYKSSTKTMPITINIGSKKTIITRKNTVSAFEMNNLDNCDIIILPENDNAGPIDFGNSNVHRFIIVFGRVISLE